MTKISGAGPYSAFVALDPKSEAQLAKPEDRQKTWCEKCASFIEFGDFPWCSGDPRDHQR